MPVRAALETLFCFRWPQWFSTIRAGIVDPVSPDAEPFRASVNPHFRISEITSSGFSKSHDRSNGVPPCYHFLDFCQDCRTRQIVLLHATSRRSRASQIHDKCQDVRCSRYRNSLFGRTSSCGESVDTQWTRQVLSAGAISHSEPSKRPAVRGKE